MGERTRVRVTKRSGGWDYRCSTCLAVGVNYRRWADAIERANAHVKVHHLRALAVREALTAPYDQEGDR